MRREAGAKVKEGCSEGLAFEVGLDKWALGVRQAPRRRKQEERHRDDTLWGVMGIGSQHGSMPSSRGTPAGTCPNPSGPVTQGEHLKGASGGCCVKISQSGRFLVRLQWKTPSLQIKTHSRRNLHIPSRLRELRAPGNMDPKLPVAAEP